MTKKEREDFRTFVADEMKKILNGLSEEEAKEVRERWLLFGFDEELMQ